MNYRVVLMSALAVSLLSAGACQAANACRGSKIWRSCSSNANYGLCNDDQLCKMQADAAADFTCYSFKVPCTFQASNLEDSLFAGFRYPIVRTIPNVPRELVPQYQDPY